MVRLTTQGGWTVEYRHGASTGVATDPSGQEWEADVAYSPGRVDVHPRVPAGRACQSVEIRLVTINKEQADAREH